MKQPVPLFVVSIHPSWLMKYSIPPCITDGCPQSIKHPSNGLKASKASMQLFDVAFDELHHGEAHRSFTLHENSRVDPSTIHVPVMLNRSPGKRALVSSNGNIHDRAAGEVHGATTRRTSSLIRNRKKQLSMHRQHTSTILDIAEETDRMHECLSRSRWLLSGLLHTDTQLPIDVLG